VLRRASWWFRGLEIAALAPEVARAHSRHHARRLAVRRRPRQRTLPTSCARQPRWLRLVGATAAIQAAGGWCASARHAESRPRARPHDQSSPAGRLLLVDPTTIKHLGVVEGTEGGRAGSLLDELDATVTSMGGRLLRSWLLRPLLLLEPIRDRLDAVEELAFRGIERAKFREALKAVHDLERLVARAALGAAGPRDLVALKISLGVVPRVRPLLAELQAPLIRSLTAELDDLPELRHELERALLTSRLPWHGMAA
jgi:DNA mismatch repair protein MutS